jgi:hypothetical protein
MDRHSAANQIDPAGEDRLFEAVREAERFFKAKAAVHGALEKRVGLLAEGPIPYALIGATALNEYGYRRVTVDVNILLTREGLRPTSPIGGCPSRARLRCLLEVGLVRAVQGDKVTLEGQPHRICAMSCHPVREDVVRVDEMLELSKRCGEAVENVDVDVPHCLAALAREQLVPPPRLRVVRVLDP